MFRFRHLHSLANVRFSKRTSVPPFTHVEKMKAQTRLDRQINMTVLKRELFNDSLQLPIKYCAFLMTQYAHTN